MKGLLRATAAALLLAGCGDGPGGASDLNTQVREALAQANVTLQTPAGAHCRLACGEAGAIMSFLRSLTDPAASVLGTIIPASVPSGLPVGD